MPALKPVSRSAKVRRFPWGALCAVVLAYLTLGLNLANGNPGWSFWEHCLASILIVILILGLGNILHTWGRGNLLRLVQLGPRSVFTMFYLSSIVTLAVVSPLIFALVGIIGSTDTLLRLEMRAAGYSLAQVFFVLIPLGLGGMLLGWLCHYLISTNSLGLLLNG
ncbi:hypothetical protein RIF25_00820 [Thermosynechococcaceae cyanobacterium BACA0444]|uniref:Uncharacterized protein n=1 Tax=Pseudocalidococcus azoricus BACA0444 TaxID=2918990 RepID=A0AAE4FNH3_9CYAN|nr:hypothetical protein [Pseudocalidococcus azoricus BACA0444]